MSVYLNALLLENLSRPPVWMMRQAGRYLPEYRKLREKYKFMEMMKTPDLATEITLQPIKRYGFDAAILFSDILTTAESLGAKLDFIEKKGPVISNPIRTIDDINKLKSQPIAIYAQFVYQAIKQIKQALPDNTPLIGFAGAPFTVASYMIEGGASPDLKQTKLLIGNEPDVLHELLKKLTTETTQYLIHQINAGVDVIQIFDTWAGLLSFDDFNTFSLPYIKSIVTEIKTKFPTIPISIYCKYSTTFSPLLCQLPINCISLDWQTSLTWAKDNIPNHIAIQGNLDPALLRANHDVLKSRVLSILDTMSNRNGYIFNLGHGITPDIPFESVQLLVDTIKGYSIKTVS